MISLPFRRREPQATADFSLADEAREAIVLYELGQLSVSVGPWRACQIMFGGGA